MARILLVAPDGSDRENLATILKSKRHSIVAIAACAFVDSDWTAQIQAADIVMFDVTRLTEEEKPILRRVCQQPDCRSFPTRTLCFSRINHGPRFELAIERLGARYVYAD